MSIIYNQITFTNYILDNLEKQPGKANFKAESESSRSRFTHKNIFCEQDYSQPLTDSQNHQKSACLSVKIEVFGKGKKGFERAFLKNQPTSLFTNK